MILKTEIGLIEIREAETTDAKQIIEFMNWVTGEVDFHTYGANDFHISEDDEKRVVETFHKRENCLFLVASFQNEIIAVATLAGGVKERVAHRGTIGITIAKRFWRLGIGWSMMNALIKYSEQNRILSKLELLVHEHNLAAIKMYTKLGFYREGVLKRYFKIEGHYYDGIRMGLIVE